MSSFVFVPLQPSGPGKLFPISCEQHDEYQQAEQEYDGQINEGTQRHGGSTAVLPNGDVYQGDYVNAKRQGQPVEEMV
ncbi:radial spoke head 1 homolog [Genypterus blacodes]|uniref:radial spoke head 1 homolog n=1 Tax=Genypterus blacodes TaxID=154954 RepID=UPI003F767F06